LKRFKTGEIGDQPKSEKEVVVQSPHSRSKRLVIPTVAMLAGLGAMSAPTPAIATGSSVATSPASGSILAAFEKPSIDAKPMARMWFPDAGAGETAAGLDLVRKQINDMAAGGFGGAEIAFLADSNFPGMSGEETRGMTNEEAKEYGWGSPNWKKIVKTLLQTANAVPDGFKVDFTITTHWPPSVNNIDPNDDAASQESASAYTKITAADLVAGVVDVPEAEKPTEDQYGAPFVFENKLATATIARVKSVATNGTPTFELASLADVTDATAKKTVTAAQASSGTPYHLVKGVRYAGSAAGVPDQAYAEDHDIDYSDVTDAFGPTPTTSGFTGKFDADGNRKRMADWEYSYRTDLGSVSGLDGYTPSAGSGLAAGDYVLFGNYYRGTGQLFSNFPTATSNEYNRQYVTNYFTSDGVDAIIKFWDDHILDDDIVAMLKKNGQLGTSLFEDSIEIHKEGPLWTAGLLQKIADFTGQDATDYAPVLADTSIAFDDSTEATRLREDYNLTLGHLYETEHANLISSWAKSFGYTYRAQAYPLTGLDVGGAAATVDIPEGDNSSDGDGLRHMKGATNLAGKKELSMEAVTFAADRDSAWVKVEKELNSNFSDGVNRVILHGSAFATSFNGNNSDWPGWNFVCCGLPNGFTSMNARQAWWSDVDDFSDYVARSQAVLQAGTAKVDVGVLIGDDSSYALQSGNSMQELLDAGYSYNLLSQPLLEEPMATVTGGVLAADGPAYKALVVKKATRLSVATVERLIGYAKAGLPIVLYDTAVSRVYGTSRGSNTDAALAAKLTELAGLGNVTTASTSAQVEDRLTTANVKPASSYDIAGLESSHRHGSDGEYYYLYNANTNGAVSGQVTLTGSGTPYLLDASTGEVTPVTTYTRDGDKVTLDVDLVAQEAEFVALATDTAGFPTAPAPHATAVSAGTVTNDGKGNLTLRTTSAGGSTVQLSDGSSTTVAAAAPEAGVDLSSGWHLSLESWGPDAEANVIDPTSSKQTTITFDDIALGKWTDLPATSSQLATLGVAALNRVSGIGTYTKSFTLPSSWDAKDGLTLTLGHGNDMVTSVVVNGTEIAQTSQFTDTVDLGGLVKAGSNTIEIRLATSLHNRATTGSAQTYGLQSAAVQTYLSTSLAKAPAVTARPSISGTARTGGVLACAPGQWSGATGYTYAWTANGAAIADATSSRLTVSGKYVGKLVACVVTATGAGGATKASSPTVKVAAGAAPRVVAKPKVIGKVKVGRKVTANHGTWRPAPSSYRYQWKRDGKAIAGATRATYRIKGRDKGHRLTVSVTTVTTGYSSATATSKGRVVRK
jgi:hypothetical protein